MKRVVSAVATALLACALLAPATAQTVRPMTLYVDMDQIEQSMGMSLSPAQIAELTSMKTAIDAKEAALRTREANFARNQAVWPQERFDAERVAYQAALAEAQAAWEALKARQAEMIAAENARIAAALDRAMKDYAAGNPNLALLQQHRSSRLPDVVVRDQRYEVSDNLYERIKAGPGAVTSSPDGPTIPARVAYIRFEDAFHYSGTETVWYNRAEPDLKTYWAAASDLRSSLTGQRAMWDKQYWSMTEADRAAADRSAIALQMRIDAAYARHAEEVRFVRAEGLDSFRYDFEQFLMTDPSAAAADVIVFLGPDDPTIYALTPGIDLTIATAQAFGRAKGQTLPAASPQPVAQPISQTTDTIILYASPAATLAGSGLSLTSDAAQRLQVLQTKLAAEVATLDAMAAVYDQNQSKYSESQRIAEERSILAARTTAERSARTLVDAIQQEHSDVRADFDTRLNAALAAYRAANPGAGVVIMSRDEPGRDSFVVRNKLYDLSASLAAMVKTGPTAKAPTAPNRPAVVRYVNFQRAFELTGGNARIAYTIPTAEFPAKEIRDYMEADFRERLAAFLLTDPSASAAEVIRFTGPGEFMGDISIYFPRLDITDAVATAYKRANP
jgi:hypothetical protein